MGQDPVGERDRRVVEDDDIDVVAQGGRQLELPAVRVGTVVQ